MKKKQGFTLRSVAGEQVLVPEGLANIDFSRIISFNDTAAFLWQRLGNDEFDVPEMVALLVGEYEVSPDTARSDAAELLRAWQEAGIITA